MRPNFVTFLKKQFELTDSEGNVSSRVIGIIAMLIGALLCYAGSKLKGRNGDTTAFRDKRDDDSGGRPWWKTDPKYAGALIDQQQRRMLYCRKYDNFILS